MNNNDVPNPLRQVSDAADKLLQAGIVPTPDLLMQSVSGDRREIRKALEGWAASLTPAASSTLEAARRAAKQSQAKLAERAPKHVNRALNSANVVTRPAGLVTVESLELELERQRKTVRALCSRLRTLRAAIPITEKKLSAAQLRAQLLEEGIRKGGQLLDQKALLALRSQVRSRK